MMKRLMVVLAAMVWLAACTSEPQLVEVTRIVETKTEVEVEVTRLIETEIEVEVTRLVEATVEVTRIVQETVLVTPTSPLPTATLQSSVADAEREFAQLDLAAFTDTWLLAGEGADFVYEFRDDGTYTNTFNGVVAESGTWEALGCNTICLIAPDRNSQCNIWSIRGDVLFQFVAGHESQYYNRQEAEADQ